MRKPWAQTVTSAVKPAFNAAVLLDRGQLLLEQHKRLLPFYDVFDEQRYFSPSEPQKVIELDGVRLAITICEDAWNDKNFWPRRLYTVDPMEELMRQHPALHINISSSPFWHSKRAIRREMLAAIARRDAIPVLMSNQVGGNDSLIFDGSSLALNARGELIAQAASFEEDLVVVDPFSAPPVPVPEDDDTEAAYRALVLGTRDYVRKCGFRKALVGLSGGIDSALVAAIATEALGAENVIGVGMPSPYSSSGSIDDSRQLAANLGIRFETLSISALFAEFTRTLEPLFAGMKTDITEENIQPRIRATLLMALSNKFGALVLTTGNKSEMAVGYCTLYGDMVGALAVIGDLVKTRVYAVCRWLNREREVIPAAILAKPPSAELRPGPDGHRFAAALRRPRSHRRGLRRALRDSRTHRSGARFFSRSRPTGGAPDGAIRVQAPAGRAGSEGYLQVVRHGPQIPHRRQGPGLAGGPV